MIKYFSESLVKPIEKGLKGEKIKPKKILNKIIIVHKYVIKDSKYEGKCLYMEIDFEDERRVVFTGSGYLMEMLEQMDPIDGFPFRTIIIQRDDNSYIFTAPKKSANG